MVPRFEGRLMKKNNSTGQTSSDKLFASKFSWRQGLKWTVFFTTLTPVSAYNNLFLTNEIVRSRFILACLWMKPGFHLAGTLNFDHWPLDFFFWPPSPLNLRIFFLNSFHFQGLVLYLVAYLGIPIGGRRHLLTPLANCSLVVDCRRFWSNSWPWPSPGANLRHRNNDNCRIRKCRYQTSDDVYGYMRH